MPLDLKLTNPANSKEYAYIDAVGAGEGPPNRPGMAEGGETAQARHR